MLHSLLEKNLPCHEIFLQLEHHFLLIKCPSLPSSTGRTLFLLVLLQYFLALLSILFDVIVVVRVVLGLCHSGVGDLH
jgi:hypothetical protein